MIKLDYFKYIILFILIVLLQTLIFNNLVIQHLFYCIPIVYLFFIFTLPIHTKSIIVIFLGFILGFTIDVFCNTLGVNAAATTFVAFLRQPVLHIFLRDKEDVQKGIPSIKVLGWATYLKYTILLLSIQILSIAFLEYFDYYNWSNFLPRVLSSILLSILIIIAMDFLFNNSNTNE